MKITETAFLITGKGIEKLGRLTGWFHSRYAKAYLSYKKVDFHHDIAFFGTPKIRIGQQALVKIGKQFICRSGRDTKLDNGAYSTMVVLDGSTLTIGDFSGMTNAIIVCGEHISIGNHVNIGNGTIVMDTDLHSMDWKTRSDRQADPLNSHSRPIVIADHVFIGARCIILKGVTIGEKSIVAAGSVVTKNIPEGEVWGGNPAKFIKKIEE